MIGLSRIAIITADADLAEKVCSRLRKRGFYLPVIEAPMVRLVEYGVFRNDCIRVANIIRALQPKTVIFLRVRSEVVAELEGRLRELSLVFLDEFDERILSNHLRFTRNPIGLGDLLVTDPESCACDLFVVEGDFDVSHVIASNLAIAHCGRVLVIPRVSEEEVDLLKEAFRSWSNGSFEEQQHSKEAILRCVRERLPEQLLRSVHVLSISFITKGIPYGVFPFRCPTTHYFSFPLLGLSVLSGMLKSQDVFRCPVAVLIDPNLVGQSEFEVLRSSLGKAGYHLRLAYGTSATVQSATYLCQHLPSDFIFFSTHCGEVTGRRIVERFIDRSNRPHEICYDLALSACPAPGSELIEVLGFICPVSLDGVNWSDTAAKKRIRAGDILEDFIKLSRADDHNAEKRQVLSTTESEIIKGSDALAMHDGNYFPLPQVVGGYHCPVVFNNACSSWHALARNLGCGGACCYIGAATLVLNLVGMEIGSAFARSVALGKSVGMSLYSSQRPFTEQFGYSPYLMHGYLQTRLSNPNPRAGAKRVVERLVLAIQTTAQNAGKKGVDSALAFIERELEGLIAMRRRVRR